MALQVGGGGAALDDLPDGLGGERSITHHPAVADFDLASDNDVLGGITFANGRLCFPVRRQEVRGSVLGSLILAAR